MFLGMNWIFFFFFFNQPSPTGKPIEDAMHRSIRWLDRCIYAHQRPHDQFVFPSCRWGCYDFYYIYFYLKCWSSILSPSSSFRNLFAIIQGGLVPELREYCLEEMIKRDTPGYAIGGLSGGESKHDFWKVRGKKTLFLKKYFFFFS